MVVRHVPKRAAEYVDSAVGSLKRMMTDKSGEDVNFERAWNILNEVPAGWDSSELEPEAPSSDWCFAALFHGHKHEYLAYACVLGRRLRDSSPGFDRVLLCGGGYCEDVSVRRALMKAGWNRLLPVAPIEAPHLDKTRAKRHALVFTKLRTLELPYSRVLLLDLDLFPRDCANLKELFEVEAPAAKYHCTNYQGPDPAHGDLIPAHLQEGWAWCPNAGVMRLNPEAQALARCTMVESMIEEVMQRQVQTYLPEQYYLAERLMHWRHIDRHWNWEVWPEWDDPSKTHPTNHACDIARQRGWAGYYSGSRPDDPPDAAEVLRKVRIWHFSGSWDTAPWMFQDLQDASAVREFAAALFKARDPGGIVATAHFEWRQALDSMLEESAVFEPLRIAVVELAKRATESRERAWKCDDCGMASLRIRKLDDLPYRGTYCVGQWAGLQWVCADCIVGRLRACAPNDCPCTMSYN